MLGEKLDSNQKSKKKKCITLFSWVVNSDNLLLKCNLHERHETITQKYKGPSSSAI